MDFIHTDRAFRHKNLSESSTACSTIQHLDPPSPLTPRPKVHPCEAVYLLPTRVATVLLALIQGGLLDCYLVRYNNRYWYAWIAGDVAVIILFAAAFVISYRQLRDSFRAMFSLGGEGGGSPSCYFTGGNCCIRSPRDLGTDVLQKTDGEGPPPAGSMPMMYFAWLAYSSMLAIRVVLVYKNFAHELVEDNFFGPNTLQVTVSAAAIVFLFVLWGHHDTPPDSSRRHRIDALTYTVVFDIVDGVDLLTVFLDTAARDSMVQWVQWVVLGVTCLNLVLPTVPLMALSRMQFGARRLPEDLQTMHRFLILVGVNLPLLAVRLLLWQHLHLPVSTFIVKNVAISLLVIYSFYDRDHHGRLQARIQEMQEMMS